MYERLSRWMLPTVLAILVLAPAAGVVLNGRNLQAVNHYAAASVASGAAEWLLRLATLSVVALSGLVVLDRMLLRPLEWPKPRQSMLLAAFLLFFATNVLLPGLFGQVPGTDRGYIYAFLLFLAVFFARTDGSEHLVDVAKWSIMLLVLGSFVFIVLRPDSVLRTDAAELRLPGVPFRLWGLSSSPNSLGPISLTLLLITIVRPFASRLLTVVALVAGTMSLVLSQSQTSWIAAVVIVPPLLLYRRQLATRGSVSISVPAWVWLPLAASVLAGLVLVLTSFLGALPQPVEITPGLQSTSGDFLTGRGAIWRLAWRLFTDNPFFGYGTPAWAEAFRTAMNMPFAYHAHNQVMQSLSVAGSVGVIGLAVYWVVLARGSLRAAAATGGLAPALAALATIGSISEAPLDLATPLLGETLRHALLFGMILSAYAREPQPSAEVEAAGSEPARPRVPAPRPAPRRPTVAAHRPSPRGPRIA
ncbi:MAG: O-antigen ligase family protein [Hyphomicrobiaceae bacterium]